MIAHRAHGGSGFPDDNMPAIAAFPDRIPIPGEDQTALHLGQQSAIPLLMGLFYGADHFEFRCDLLESLFPGFPGHAGIHIGPLKVLSVRCGGQIVRSPGHRAAIQVLEPDFGVFLFVGRSLFKYRRDSLISILFCF